MEVVPQEVRFAAAKLAAFNRNRVKLETSGATSASAGNIVTVTLPENAVIDLKSFKVHMRLETNANGVGTAAHVFAKLPADVSSLISNFEVYIGGVQVSQSCAEFNSCCKILKIARSSRDRDGSIDSTLAHGAITTSEAIDDVNVVFAPPIGFFAESATRYMPTSITGPITVRFTMAPNSVLAHKLNALIHGTNLTAQGILNSSR